MTAWTLNRARGIWTVPACWAQYRRERSGRAIIVYMIISSEKINSGTYYLHRDRWNWGPGNTSPQDRVAGAKIQPGNMSYTNGQSQRSDEYKKYQLLLFGSQSQIVGVITLGV